MCYIYPIISLTKVGNRNEHVLFAFGNGECDLIAWN